MRADGVSLGFHWLLMCFSDKSNTIDLLSEHLEKMDFKILGRAADLVVMVNCQIPSDDLIVHFF